MTVIDRRGQNKKDEEKFIATVGELGSRVRVAVGTGTNLLPTQEEISATLTSDVGPLRKGTTRVGEHIAREYYAQMRLAATAQTDFIVVGTDVLGNVIMDYEPPAC